MTRKEFKEKLAAIGVEVCFKKDDFLALKINGSMIAIVRENYTCTLDTNFSYWKNDLTKSRREEILPILVEYAMTPLNMRHDSKRFYLANHNLDKDLGNYLSRFKNDSRFSYGRLSVPSGFQTIFTQDEVDDIKLTNPDVLLGVTLVEVEDEE